MRGRLLLIAVFLPGLLAACATADPLSSVSVFDQTSGESLMHPPRPVVLLTKRPGLSVVGKDYLALSPVTVSGRGATSTWLWCALSSSIDRTMSGAPAPDVTSIVLLVDDVPMRLDIEPWSEAARQSPFELPADAHESFAARITGSQLRRIANSTNLEAYVADTSARSRPYTLSLDHRSDWGY